MIYRYRGHTLKVTSKLDEDDINAKPYYLINDLAKNIEVTLEANGENHEEIMDIYINSLDEKSGTHDLSIP